MRKRLPGLAWFAGLLCLALAFSAVCPALAAAAQTEEASLAAIFPPEKSHSLGTWWWNTDFMKKDADRTARLDFLQQSGVTEIYVYYGNAFEKYYRAFVADCTARDIRVAALGGDARWLTDEGFKAYQRWLEKARKYQESAAPEERFYGIHLDFEPYQLPEYAADPAALVGQVGRVYDEGRAFCDAQGLLLEADVSMWIDDPSAPLTDEGAQVTLGAYIARRVDTLCIMAYRDTAKAQYGDAQPMIRLGMQFGKKVVLGSETGPVPSEPEFITYFEEGKATMAAELRNLYALLSETHGDIGLAIHYVDAWLTLKN